MALDQSGVPYETRIESRLIGIDAAVSRIEGIVQRNALEAAQGMAAFHKFCRENALSYSIEYSEAEDCFSLSAKVAGNGEEFHVKRCKTLQDGTEYLLTSMKKFYEQTR